MAMQMENCATHQPMLALRLLVAGLFCNIGRSLLGASTIIVLLLVHSVQVNAQPAAQTNLQENVSAGVPEAPAVAEAVLLQLKPSRCVALHQGQMCYQTIQLLWSAPQAGNYCLYQQDVEQPLHCWQNVNAGEYRYEFSSDTSVQLQLVNSQTKTVVAQTGLEVAWVYKTNTRRQTHWRLF